MSQVYLAFYKGRSDHHGLARLSDWLTRLVTRGEYSHCELAVEQGNGEFLCYSSSVRDKGVRRKQMPLPHDKWDLIALNALSISVEQFFRRNDAMKYDWLGAVGFVVFNRGRENKYFCSEFCADFLGLVDSWRYSPNMLHALASSIQTMKL
ncbi:hypothetical protein LE270_03130 [Salmonella enterica subsp. enterica serovar Hillegersberg]|uniref:hypothetical protein n=1 Tax=Salmonella enterica TaxID=28901 RepID=UPI001D076796|nr:hypothetical protein [Salmonella enterica]MCB7131067.1 hypothetical protein [Salmonella enterica subsp. enterica serovar Hillegersberg]